MEMTAIATWTFVGECPIPADLQPILVGDERPVAAYKTFRDAAVFTTKRLIVRDSQGLTGKKVEMYSLPYSSINMWSTENAGTLDLNAEVELWTRAGHIKIKLGKGVDVRKIDSLIGWAVLNG
ncbi:PH domain-containing protein [Luteococcus sp. H138]|uniref:PH domain-containing protein n=1 Tax=unclassified Luteococcus TaxID=2639923 RepID=UPI00313F1700